MSQYILVSYPRQRPKQQPVEIELEDVRAANALLISFDFERDGWVIQSPIPRTWEAGDDSPAELEEVAFVPAWSERAGKALDRINK